MAARINDVDDEEELGAYIYQTSHTAKIFREKAAEASLSAPLRQQAQRKSPRLLTTKSKEQDIPTLPEKATVTSNISIQQRTKRKRKLVLKEEGDTSLSPKSLREQNKGGRYACGQKRKLCSHEGCTNVLKEGGVCVRHGAKVRRCKREGCNNIVRIGGVCIKHGAPIKRCSQEGCTNYAQRRGVCVRHGASWTRKTCSYKGCTAYVQNGGVCIRHGAKVKLCGHEGCTNNAKKGGVCRRHGKVNMWQQRT